MLLRKHLFPILTVLLLVACSPSQKQEIEENCAALLGRLVTSSELNLLNSSKRVASQKNDKSLGRLIYIYYSPGNNASYKRTDSSPYDLLCVADTSDRKPFLIADVSYHLRIMRLGLVDPRAALRGLIITGIVSSDTAQKVDSYVRNNQIDLAVALLGSSYSTRLEMINEAFSSLNIDPIQ